MRFGDRERTAVPFPDLFEQPFRTEHACPTSTHCFNVRVGLLSVAAMTRNRIFRDPMVQKSLTRDVMIQSENVGRTRIVEKPFQLGFVDADVPEVPPHPLSAIQLAAQ